MLDFLNQQQKRCSTMLLINTIRLVCNAVRALRFSIYLFDICTLFGSVLRWSAAAAGPADFNGHCACSVTFRTCPLICILKYALEQLRMRHINLLPLNFPICIIQAEKHLAFAISELQKFSCCHTHVWCRSPKASTFNAEFVQTWRRMAPRRKCVLHQ